ncbi:MAG: DUF3592 domain-containing protein [Actinomycetota bacterium]|nr:DUF3592 domain-containing protein [Actinomycetota bacterium]
MAVAWDSPQTRQDWRSYRRAGLRWLAAAAACLVLAIGGGQLALAHSRTLLTEGSATRGTVTAVEVGRVSFRYDAQGQSFESTLDVVSDRVYRRGEEVGVRYDRGDPATARLVDEPRRVPLIGPAVVAVFLVALIAVPVGVGSVWRALVWRRALSRHPWRLARLRIHGSAVSLTVPGEEPVTARLLSTTRWRTKTLLGLDGRELWMLADGRHVLLTADGTNTLYGARSTA